MNKNLSDDNIHIYNNIELEPFDNIDVDFTIVSETTTCDNNKCKTIYKKCNNNLCKFECIGHNCETNTNNQSNDESDDELDDDFNNNYLFLIVIIIIIGLLLGGFGLYKIIKKRKTNINNLNSNLLNKKS